MPINQPSDINFLSPLGFKFTIAKLPNFEYFIQKFDFPSLSLNRTNDIQTPFNKIIVAGDHTTWDEFTVTFKIDEDMNSYFEIYDWIVGDGKPESFSQYANVAAANSMNRGVMVDADLLILNGTMNPNIKVTFQDVIPVTLSGFTFDSTEDDVNYITATASFKYRQYVYQRVVA